MQIILNIPDDLADELRRRAERDGRPWAEEIVDLLKLSVRPKGAGPEAAKPVGTDHKKPDRQTAGLFSYRTDPVTRLPLIDSPADAPIRSMSPEQVVALIEAAELEEDPERAGIAVRH